MDVVMNYPWWQMVSCLVCAASVMILAECCDKQDPTTDTRDATLREDSETCIEVLAGLSIGSTGARLAFNMLKGLREKSARISDKLHRRAAEGLAKPQLSGQTLRHSPENLVGPLSAVVSNENIYPELLYCGGDASFGVGIDDGRSTVVPDSMHWPLEFLNMLEDPQNSFDGHTNP
ncbi:hypothetical protein G7054_g4559 [Neopestalotiopsis clavispora]|nr:hypothetical protein G7054_g4559 [Neopestalotiopsis clavispora]